MANIPERGLNLNQAPYLDPKVFPYNLYHGLYPRYDPMDMYRTGLISPLMPNLPHLDFHCNTKEDLVHILPKGPYSDKDNDFCIYLDVSLFSPEELTVKIVNDHLIVEGIHEERQAHDNGFVTRNFKRRYELPKGYNPDAIASKLSSDGVLKVTLPKATTDPKVRMIPIQQAGPSNLFVKNKDVNYDKDDTNISTEKVEIEDAEKADDQK